MTKADLIDAVAERSQITLEGLRVQRLGGEADLTACGTASDLDLFLWGRLPAGALEVRGSAELLDRFQ
ncbi:MAG: hypothetical protein WCP21_23140, partial [Armatimonadota bacterium]